MKEKVSSLIFLGLFITACDPGGNLFLINGYPHDVIIYSTFEHKDKIFELSENFAINGSFAPANKKKISI
ncbi:MAG: hypothetical protein LBV68_01595 [Spirochaetaceae bacterium]|jgi:hypothetical protein|nr:hypothetical protein [Spirochaetaceae bacterium]